ncbi:yjeF C-terminal region, hydroxyethylthiazole kinase-related/yjeF N-terminal region [Roseovarius pacificus]|uniref:Bifunctional NAD(P)H-hydrate repair enzyme n=1 Tax=Roseovarius pacificus TaxID=337701 RepID=A0A1M7EJQ0_9RHOB|nr:bifunctional ADP-dependent NAD(P)H-hydrate dehydratase/NAD(P)H-hydrate epimerase [Roseovarius pacificus]GGO57769.1 bifunctional NAD(P)H-hydrate repair enzyme [Roseovarius pacificus]SHL91944.1 yjeF C-terminal region, hydroxyethylthiazole kinase-related/yjeF N-terminal region [Roseovarius pacificus]
MTELLTAALMRAIERAAIESGEVTGLDLMERAGRGVVEAVFEEWPELAKAPHRAVVLCGPGNNGGDGFVVARLLKDWGWEVEVFLYGDPTKLPPDARANYERWRKMGEVGAIEDAPRFAHEADLFVDALFGTGLAWPLEGAALTWVTDREADPNAQAKTVAVDIPSGLCSDSGRELGHNGATVLASLTVSFHAVKLGHYLQWGPFKCGRTVVADIGLRADMPRDRVRVVDASHSKFFDKADGAHKYTHGHALILSGGAGRTGAARLAARGALRIGAGLVTLGVPGSAQMEVACQITALMLRRVEDGEALAGALEDERLNALCLGPGMGMERARDLVPVAVRAQRAPYVVLDADALTAFADDPEALFAMLHDKCVLTPHGGEFARLFPDIAEKLHAPAVNGPAYSKVDATREAARRAGCVVLFKGPDTVIAAPDGRCSINSAQYERAAPWLATAGAGDVLAGFIAGLLARGLAPMQAAETAAWLHVEAARAFGPGLIAEDLPEMLPTVLRDLGL